MTKLTKEQYEIAKLVIKTVNKYFETDCRLKSRKMNIVRPRMYASKLIRDLSGMNLEDIGSIFGLTHGTVIHSISTVNSDIEISPKFRRYYFELKALIENSEHYSKTSVASATHKYNVMDEIYKLLVTKSQGELGIILNKIKEDE